MVKQSVRITETIDSARYGYRLCEVGAEQGCRCIAGAEVQVCRVCAEVQSICKGPGEVIVQVMKQRRCRYGGAATDMQRCR